MNMIFQIVAISLLLSLALIYLFQKYYLKKKFFDDINERSSHSVLATRSGGIAIFITLFFLAIYYYFNEVEIFDYSLIIPLSLLLIVGLYDDIYNVDFKLKLLFQIITAKILIDNGFIIDNFHGFLGIEDLNRIIAQLFSVFIIVAIINSINFIDGIDGLAALVVSLFIISYEFFSVYETTYSILSLIILSSILPFLYFNILSKKKVFLGDSGSLFLGGVVSILVLNILSNNYVIKEQYDINKILYVISILSYPIIDIIRVFFLRLLNGKSPFQADKNHLHHILLNKFKSHFQTTFFIISVSLIITVVFQILF
jgi:UDP-N-acetylmuramyl pentapeptide phosphotransferase/UDP-N-acetylglucosamine-1-phosphate transferase|tara:strand:+ start:2733 stop:3671 length:939 start_codon:yes stop_codon:yes gene_type:complete